MTAVPTAGRYAFTAQPDGTILVSGGTRPYTIIPDPQGCLCNCDGFRFSKGQPHTCKHLELYAAAQTRATEPLESPPDFDEPSEPLEPPAAVEAAPSAAAPPADHRLPDPPGAPAPDPDTEPLNDLGNARRFVRLHGVDMRYAKAHRRWYYWRERRWAEDETGEADRRAKAVIDELLAAAARERDPDRQKKLATHGLRSASAPRIASLLELASTEAAVVLTGREFDAGPWLLNVLNGTFDLKTGALRPHTRDNLLTKLAPVRYDPSAPAPRWAAFLDQVLVDPALVAYVQRTIGYALTGVTSEHAFFLLHGTGANGKTTFLETLRTLFGDYARQADFATFLARRDEGPRNDIARLRGARFVTASEVAEGRRFDEPALKQMTGEDTVAARKLYQEAEEFRPQFKLFLAANHKPVVWGTDHAFWRRLRLIPFTVTIPPAAQDKQLRATLHAELPGILRWAIEGCRAWQRDGLAEPDVVTAATRSYQADQDVIGQFLTERCVVSSNGTRANVEQKALFDAYLAWCTEVGTEQLGARKFNDRVRERGYADRRSNGRRLWDGLGLSTGTAESEEPDALPF